MLGNFGHFGPNKALKIRLAFFLDTQYYTIVSRAAAAAPPETTPISWVSIRKIFFSLDPVIE